MIWPYPALNRKPPLLSETKVVGAVTGGIGDSNKEKITIFSVFIALLMALAMMPVNVAQVYAEDTTTTNQGLLYTFDVDNKTASVTGFTDDLPSEVVIPSTVQKSETNTEYDYMTFMR